MDIAQLENAARYTWPALSEIQNDNGLLRFAAGVSRRANAMTPSVRDNSDSAAILRQAQDFYCGHGLPATLRVLTDGETATGFWQKLDLALQSAGYEYQARTDVMLVKAADFAGNKARVQAHCLSLSEWLKAWQQVRGFPAAQLPVLTDMLSRIGDPHRYLALTDDRERPVATAMGVLTDGLLGISAVATASTHRRQGFSSNVLASLLDWGFTQGARCAFLQVESDNTPALGLYQKFGFTRRYSYWYRVQGLSGQGET